ncbi:hypothetical protein Tco_1003859 [Tanacetum coccineum]|uniref:Uncharacterized protein n=1 Tax=Tanacetum coccineum TaxID=301880 RepID=A0ABQ5FAN5_9ASTR
MLQKEFKDYTGYEPETYRRSLLRYLDDLDKLIDERILEYRELRMKESDVKAIKEIENKANLSTDGTSLDASLVTKGTTLDASLVTEGIAMDASLVAKQRNDADAKKILVDMTASNIENADIKPSYDSDAVSEVHHNMFKNVFAHGIQNHEQTKSIPNTYMVNENNSNIISDIPNMDPNRGKEEHNDVDYEQQCAFFVSLINNLKCDVEKCNKVNHEAQQANALLTNDLERYKEKEKHFAKETVRFIKSADYVV